MGISGAFGAMTGANALNSATTAYSQSQAIKTQGNYQKNQLQFNAQIADLQAQDAIRRGDKEVKNKKIQTKQMIGTQRAALAAQGIEVNDDSALLIQEDTAGLGAEDAASIKSAAWREAWGYKVQNVDYTGQANMAQISSGFNARQTLLTGGLQFARDVGSGAMSYAKNKSLLDSYDKRGTVGKTGKSQSQILGYNTAAYR